MLSVLGFWLIISYRHGRRLPMSVLRFEGYKVRAAVRYPRKWGGGSLWQ